MTEEVIVQQLPVPNMIKSIREGKELHEEFAKKLEEKMLIQGKTMETWKKHFQIKVPQMIDLTNSKELATQILELYQEAAFLKAMAEASSSLHRKGYETQYRQKFDALVETYKASGQKLPASNTLEILAKNDIDDVETGLVYSEVTVKFWKEILDYLNFIRKVLETATITNSVEARIAR